MNIRIPRFLITALVTQLTIFTPGSSYAAPGTLANVPLFLSTSVEPNIYFLLDDSGSMEWDNLTPGGLSGLPDLDGWTGNNYILPTADNGFDQAFITAWGTCTDSGRIGCYPYTTPSEDSVAGAWRVRNSNFNALYYDPSVTYTPWRGVDSSNTPLYADANPSSAPSDPNDPSGDTLDLTQSHTFWAYTVNQEWYIETIFPAYYYTWSDDDGDGFVDTTDSHTLVEIVPSTATYPKAASRTDCAGSSCTYAEEIQNFANWFTYYRKRSYVAKAAIGALSNENASARMGLQLYNNNIDDAPSRMAVNSEKTSYLQNLYGLNIRCDSGSCPGTPARRALEDLGDLFESNTDSPILPESDGGACQQNFSVVVTDGYWNGADPAVGNADANTSNIFDGGAYADGFSDTLADVAMHYYKNDLKPDITNAVPTTPTVDEADHQHLVTYTVAFGVTGSLDPFGTKTPGDASDTDPTDAAFNWPDPDAGDEEKIDDMWHAAYNGRGLFLSAQDPQQLASSLSDAISDIAARTGSAAAVAFNSTILEAGSVAYLARFNSGDWSGELLAYDIDPFTGNLSPTPDWNAGDELDSQSPASRTILSYNGAQGIPFQWSDLTVAQQDDLRTNDAGGVDSDTIAQARLDFLRGDRSNEGTGYGFRTRTGVLGDLIHSNPIFVGEPQMNYPDSAPFPSTTGAKYSEFKTQKASRDGTVYVGSNDGMLHGFDGATGQEVMAYIPSNLFSSNTSEGLHYLTSPSYSHRYYSDLSPSVSDVFVKTTPTNVPAWRTVLIGGERAGGRGIYALDITNPQDFSESGSTPDDIVMWEFTSADDNDLGFSFSKPTITLTNITDSSGNYRWAAIVGNGYNATNGVAKLFILFLDGGIDGSWTTTADYATTDYIEISTEVGNASDINGLSTPALVDLDGDGITDRVYAGDIKGNLWAFDLCNEDTNGDCQGSGWDVAYKNGTTPSPLFIAKDGASNIQPITVKPVVIKHPTVAKEADGSNAPNVLVFFGTGQYLVEGDRTSTEQQSFYGVWDDGTDALERNQLVEQTFQSSFPSNVRVPTNNDVPYSATDSTKRYGWYIDLPTTGERVVANPKVRGSQVFFNSLIPETTACTYGGYGWLHAVNQSNGGYPDEPVFDYNGDGQVDDNDIVSDGTQSLPPTAIRFDSGLPTESSFLGTYQYTASSDGDVEKMTIKVESSGLTGRLSWQELLPD